MNRLKNFLHYNVWIVLLDVIAVNLSYVATLYLRFFINGTFRESCWFYMDFWAAIVPWYTAAAIVIFAAWRLYGGLWQYAGLNDMNRIILANVSAAVAHVVISLLVIGSLPGGVAPSYAHRMPMSYYIIGPVIQLGLTTLIRFGYRLLQEERRRSARKHAANVMIVGIGDTGRMVRRQIENDDEGGSNVVCFFAWQKRNEGQLINGAPVVSDEKKLKDHISRYKVDRVILADPLMPGDIRDEFRNVCQEKGVEIHDYSRLIRYDAGGLSFRRLMRATVGEVSVLQDGKTTHYESGEAALRAFPESQEVRTISILNGSFFVELVRKLVQPLTVFYITNRPDVALVAEKYGVDRIWVDLETLGKEERQRNMNTVKSNHKISDIANIKPVLAKAQMLVRVNPWHEGSQEEIDQVIAAGADIIMLPYWKTPEEVCSFLRAVGGRCKTTLLLETKEAVECVDEVIRQGGFDEVHIGLNDLHLSYGMTFMFEPLADGTVEKLCEKFKQAGIPYGFGGIARLGEGMLPAEKIIMEHYRLGSTRAILSRTFCDLTKVTDIVEIDNIFRENMRRLREYEQSMATVTQEQFIWNKVEVGTAVNEIAERINYARSHGL
ncbi:MAG: hypothetical protein IKG87_16150 [Clostridia bacterium]|nr:hypothetical protein [Clostridia bacterium]